MNQANLSGAVWRKSSRSNANSSCVEVTFVKSSRSSANSSCVEVAFASNTEPARAGLVRDSKNPHGPTLSADLPHMVAALKAGHMDR